MRTKPTGVLSSNSSRVWTYWGRSQSRLRGRMPTFDQACHCKLLLPEGVRPFKALAAFANYFAMDRPEAHYSAMRICRWMAAPTGAGVVALTGSGRYLEGYPRVLCKHPWQIAEKLGACSDTDWAGCPQTRRSTNGGCLVLGSHLIKFWGPAQAAISLSSGGAEFYEVVEASGIGPGYQDLLGDLGWTIPLGMWTDSIAPIGICGRSFSVSSATSTPARCGPSRGCSVSPLGNGRFVGE